MDMKYFMIVLASFFLLTCGHKGDKNDPLYKEVMAIHDEVMPKMSTMHKIKKQLRQLPNSSEKEVLNLLQNLDEADEAMMVWMADFDPPADGAERKTYLTAELESVTAMANKINTSISVSEAYLTQNR